MLIWVLVVVALMGLAAFGIREATKTWNPDLTRELQITAVMLLIGVLVAVARRRRS